MRYANAKTTDLPAEVEKAVLEALEGNKGLFLHGNTGTGKTHAMHALANNKRAEVDNFTELLVEFRDHIQNGSYHKSVQEYCAQERVFIDDIGSEKTSDFVLEFLYLIVNKRYENTKRTVLSTNLSLEDFEERYGSRILSRISEMCVFVELQGEDKRIS